MAKPLFQHIYLHEQQSYNILKVSRPYFVVPWHFHPEIELMNIVKGEGTRFVGDSIENFEAGDLVLVGADLPHCWKSGPRHYEKNKNFRAIARVILFREDSFGKDFFNALEFKKIKELLIKAQRGIRFTGKTASRIAEKIAKAYGQHGISRFIAFIDIMDDLSQSKEFTYLTSVHYKSVSLGSDMERMSAVLDYIMNNFREPIRLKDIADCAYMSPTAFCRYFKAHTNKTVVSFINEVRISYAKKLLIESDDKISDICYLCGFSNASNFYEQFKKIAGCSPLQYRNENESSELNLDLQLGSV